MKDINIVNNHEHLYRELNFATKLLDHAMEVFELVNEPYIDQIRVKMLDCVHNLENLLEK